MSVTLTFQSTLTVAETLPGNAPFAPANGKVVTHNLLNTAGTFTGSSTPPVTTIGTKQQALSTGAATVDLSSWTGAGTNGSTVNFTGLKIQFMKLRNPIGNPNPITIKVGASNGYEIGGADWSVTLQPGEAWTYEGHDTSPDVASGAKTLDLTGTGSQAMDMEIVAG